MSKYTKEEQEFLDKAAIAYMQGKVANIGHAGREVGNNGYTVALHLLTERKKLFGNDK